LLIDSFLFPFLVASARDGGDARTELIVPSHFRRVYRGTLTLTAHHGELMAVVAMDREDAVLSVVAAEMPANAPREALQAQAIIARSFLAAGARHTESDFCDTTHCQFLRSPDDASAAAHDAVAATHNLVLMWNHRPLAALYSSQCGGRTNTLREAAMDPGDSYPYFSVSCAWCIAHAPRWRAAPVPGATPPKPGAEAARIRYVRRWGWSALPGNRFTATDGPSGAHLEGRAVGHSIGLCQQGAIAMAANGADSNAILTHYYPDTTIEPAP
jgi:stage II sporulation protein D